jgi:hypothetical protein
MKKDHCSKNCDKKHAHMTHKAKKHVKHESPNEKKVGKVMHEWAEGKLHSGSKKGPKVKSRKQAIAIGLSEARKAGEKVKPAKKRK